MGRLPAGYGDGGIDGGRMMTIKDLLADWVAWTAVCFVVVGGIKLFVVVLGWLF
ncbi:MULTISPECIES: hypothetical protein [Lactiplantibacillus]|nr:MULTISPECIES: hypothetical protein [Lactiplantibacillus]